MRVLFVGAWVDYVILKIHKRITFNYLFTFFFFFLLYLHCNIHACIYITYLHYNIHTYIIIPLHAYITVHWAMYVFLLWFNGLFCPYPSWSLHWHWGNHMIARGNHMIAPVPVK